MNACRNIRALAATALPLSLLSLPALAEEAAEGGSLPQFNPAFYPEQIFWLVVSFAVLYALMAFVALPRVAKTKVNRKTVISSEIESARAANESAKASVALTEKSLAEAREKAQAKVNEMLAKVSEETGEHQSKCEKDLLRKLRRTEEDIATTRTKALEQVHAHASELADAIVAKILEAKKRVKA